jgi:uncharacterized membrane protein
MIQLSHVYYALGALLGWIGWQSAHDRSNPRRATTAAFWVLLALLFLIGDRVPPAAAGAAVLVLAAIAGFGGVGSGRSTGAAAAKDSALGGSAEAAPPAHDGTAPHSGRRLLLPVLLIPLGTLIGATGLSRLAVGGALLFEAKQATLISLALACVLALIAALWLLRERPAAAVAEGRRLLEAIGWTALLPSLLAMLGSVLTQAGAGTAVAALVRAAVPMDSRWVAVLAYGGGMAALTMIMGNAFAAFPVMTAGVGLPLLVKLHGADPAALGAIGMLTGYCGTLMTPMAANFNIVPVALLGLSDQNAVIKAQLATALPLFLTNLVLMYVLAFR